MNVTRSFGTLYLIPNTLGECALEAVMPRSVLEVSHRLDYFIAENAKSARTFLKRVDAILPLAHALQAIEIRELNVSTHPSALDELIGPILAGRDAGLVSDAGCPAVADPGAVLVRMAHDQGVVVRPLVGPSSILLALMASGLNGQNFAFNGYVPIEAKAREACIRALDARSRHSGQTQIIIETPYRNKSLLSALAMHCAPDTSICVARDLTLESESIQTRSALTWQTSALEWDRSPAIFLLQARHPR